MTMYKNTFFTRRTTTIIVIVIIIMTTSFIIIIITIKDIDIKKKETTQLYLLIDSDVSVSCFKRTWANVLFTFYGPYWL